MNSFKKWLEGIDKVLPTFIFWEFIYLIVGEVIIIAFLPLDKVSVGVGFLIGVGLAMLSSITTALALRKAFERNKRTAGKMVGALILRLAVAAGIVALAFFTGFCDPVAILVGMISVQLGVYFEPRARRKREEKEKNEEQQ